MDILKKIVVLAAVILTVFINTSCRPTPTNPPVVEKFGDTLNEQVYKINNNERSIDVPAKWVEEIKKEESNAVISINANIILPDKKMFPVYRIVPNRFSQENINCYVKYFIKDKQLFSAEKPPTKAEIEKLIIDAKADLKQAENGNTELPVKEDIQKYIDYLQNAYINAPEKNSIQQIAPVFTFVPGTKSEMLNATADMGKEKPALIVANNSSNEELTSYFTFQNGNLYTPDSKIYGKQALGQKLTPDEAAKKAEQLLNDLNLNGFCISSVETGHANDAAGKDMQGYFITCSRNVDNISVLKYIVRSKDENSSYAPKWNEGYIELCIDDSGITSFRYFLCGKIIETINKNVELLPFQKIQEIFKQQIYNKYAWVDNSNNVQAEETGHNHGNTKMSVCIDKIELGLSVIPERDKIGSFLLVPAWCFYGYTSVENNGNIEKRYDKDSIFASHLVISGIDGSLL